MTDNTANSTRDKLLRLMHLLNLDEVVPHMTIVEHGPFVLVPYGGNALALSENPQSFDRWELERQFSEVTADYERKPGLVIVTPVEFLAIILTDMSYHGFHDQMGFMLYPSYSVHKYVLFGEEIPNYGKLNFILHEAGFADVIERPNPQKQPAGDPFYQRYELVNGRWQERQS